MHLGLPSLFTIQKGEPAYISDVKCQNSYKQQLDPHIMYATCKYINKKLFTAEDYWGLHTKVLTNGK